ncbi:hypothetical protein PIB30_006466 [Stylosanthes scabra]|uniref:Uncharacterized protein n=1 Tax=Stylosanthes scabra TaxID=79078 RepID=A0ABU6V6S5_9FABA|nr:hypothetical protein [Stylosanthes scabra]
MMKQVEESGSVSLTHGKSPSSAVLFNDSTLCKEPLPRLTTRSCQPPLDFISRATFRIAVSVVRLDVCKLRCAGSLRV